MAPLNPRARPFTLTFYPCNADEEPGPYKTKVIPVNAGPVEIENAHFKGHMLLIHDTGNEPGGIAKEYSQQTDRRGVEMQFQGKFKKSVEKGGETTHGLWVGGELPEQLKLGWIMQNVVQLCMKYARKKTEGRINFVMGSKTEQPHMSFPIGQLFTVISTPPEEPVPTMGSDELRGRKWQGAGWIDILAENTYTLIYKTPYLDLCSWELLKVPGVSPLPVESILGDIFTARVMMFDLGAAGSQHQEWQKGALLQWGFARGAPGDQWEEPVEEQAITTTPSGIALADDNSDASDASEADGDEDALVAVEDHDHPEDDVASESSNSTESIAESEDEEISRADSQALFQIEAWCPRPITVLENTRARVPYYIEAIDRRRRRKVRYWYVIVLSDEGGGSDFWHAKAATELASMCRPRRRLNTFRRGPGARRYTCCAVKTLELFRHVVRHHLTSDTKLRSAVIKAAAAEEAEAQEHEAGPSRPSGDEERDKDKERESPKRGVSAGAAGLAQKVRKGRLRGPLLPPRFFVNNGSNCGLAFAHAREGRNAVARETLVGAIHFEGRLCEELMRLSSDGTIRCFTPYDCDKPRVRLQPSDLLHVQSIDGLFLGRFHLWQVQTVLRVFVFCSHDAQERAKWVQAVQGVIEAAKAQAQIDLASVMEKRESSKQASRAQAPTDLATVVEKRESSKQASNKAQAQTEPSAVDKKDSKNDSNKQDTSTEESPTPSPEHKRAAFMQKMNSTLHSKVYALRSSIYSSQPGVGDLWALLSDSTRARRWRNTRRLVLNDRLLLPESTLPPAPSFAAELLESALKLAAQPANGDILALSNSTCKLKAVRFKSWTNNELLAFWLNIYHCLLLHGWMLLGQPKSANELKRFHLRVSYLVGLRPVSLREIERIVLRIPLVDPKGTVKAHAGARARQLLGFCGLCRRRNQATGNSPPTPGSPPQGQTQGATHSKSTSRTQVAAGGDDAQGCFPMPRVPTPKSFFGFPSDQSCLFLGREPEMLALPKQDSRCVLCVNRGNKHCLPEIPVFHANRLTSELNDVAKKFTANFVQVEERHGRAVRVMVPQSCKPLAQELSPDNQVLLNYLWQFMPPESAAVQKSTKLKFCKGNEEPRLQSELKKLAYLDPNLEQDTFEGLTSVGAEFDAIAGTAQQLSKLAVPPSKIPCPPSPTHRAATDRPDFVLQVAMHGGQVSPEGEGDRSDASPSRIDGEILKL